MSVMSKSLHSGEFIIEEAKILRACLIIPIIFSFALIGIPFLIYDIVMCHTTQLSLSNKRIVGKVGLINTKSMDSPLDKINSVSVESGLGGKIFKYGTIKMQTASTEYEFKFIKNAEQFKKKVAEQIDTYKEEDMNSRAQKIAQAMKA